MKTVLLNNYLSETVLQLTKEFFIDAMLPQNAKPFDYETDFFYNNRFTDILSCSDASVFSETITKLSTGDITSEKIELQITHNGGTAQWYCAEIKKPLATDVYDGWFVSIISIHTHKESLRKASDQNKLYAQQIAQLYTYAALNETIINDSKAIIVSLNNDGHILHFNKMAEEVSGYTKEEVTGLNGISFFIHEHRFPQIHQELTTALREKKLAEYFECPVISKDGNEHIVAWRTSSVDANATGIATVHVGRDITEQLKKEKQRNKSESRFRHLAETLPLPVLCINKNNRVLFLNKEFTKTIGYTKEELVNVEDVFSRLYINNEDRAAARKRWLEDYNTSTLSTNIILRLLCKDGSVKLFEKTGWQYGDYRYNFYIDITYRQQMELELVTAHNKFKSIAENIPLALACYDKNKNLVFINKTFTETLGYQVEDIRDFSAWWSNFIFKTEDERNNFREKWIAKIESFANDKEYVFVPEEVSIKGKDGTIRYFEVSVSVEGEYVYGLFNNITKRKEAEDRLIMSERRFRNIADHTPLPVGCYDFNMQLVFLNKKFTDILGFELDEVRHFDKWFGQFVFANEELKRAKMAEWDAAIQFQKRNPYLRAPLIERQIRCKDGTIRTFEIAFSIEENFVYGLFNDITERKKTEQLLIESEQRFKNIADNTPIPICIFDEGMNITYINKKFYTTMGYSYSEVASGEYWPRYIVYKNEEEKISGREEWLDAIANQRHKLSEKSEAIERTILCRDGTEKVFTINFTLHNNLIYTILNDITERKNAEIKLYESEQKFKALAENMPIAIGSHHINGDVMFLNKHFKTTLGYTQRDIPTLRHWYEKTQPDNETREILYSHWLETVKSYRKGELNEIPYIETQVKCKNDEMKIFSFLFSIHKDVVYIMLVDITERRKAEQELIASHRQLRELASYLQKVREEERKHVAREIHDELGQLITGLKMDMSIVKKKIEKQMPELKEKLSETIAVTDTLVKTVRRIASELRPSILDDIGLGAALEWQSSEFEKRSLIECNFINNIGDFEVPFDVKSNLFRIYQESLTNILRHAEATIVTSSLEIADNILLLKIKDNGRGFSTKIHNKTLGLLGMKERAIMVNGSFIIESEPGNGTTITVKITLP